VKLALVLVTLAMALLGAPAHADHLGELKVIPAEQLKAWIDQGRRMVLIDSRVASEFRAGHIPTAINIPEPTMERAREKLPRDKQELVIFYCNGFPECKKSHDACTRAREWGYTNVHWFRDGLPAWQAKGYPVE